MLDLSKYRRDPIRSKVHGEEWDKAVNKFEPEGYKVVFAYDDAGNEMIALKDTPVRGYDFKDLLKNSL